MIEPHRRRSRSAPTPILLPIHDLHTYIPSYVPYEYLGIGERLLAGKSCRSWGRPHVGQKLHMNMQPSRFRVVQSTKLSTRRGSAPVEVRSVLFRRPVYRGLDNTP